jgi:hypothetical protein
MATGGHAETEHPDPAATITVRGRTRRPRRREGRRPGGLRGSAKSLTKSLTCADAAGETLQSATDVLVSFTEGPSGAR